MASRSKTAQKQDRTERPSGKLSRLLTLSPFVAIASVLFIYFASQILSVNLMAFFGILLGYSSEQILEWFRTSLVARVVVLLLIVLFVWLLIRALLHITGKTWREIGLNKPQARYVLWAIIGLGWYFLLFISTTVLVSVFLPQINLDQQQQLGFDRSSTGIALWVIGFCLVVIPAFYEELLMRGVLYTGVRSKFSFWLTIIVVSVIFGAAHLEWGGGNPLHWAAAIDTFALSVVLVYLREKSKSLWPAIFLHGLKNLIAFLLVFVFKAGGL